MKFRISPQIICFTFFVTRIGFPKPYCYTHRPDHNADQGEQLGLQHLHRFRCGDSYGYADDEHSDNKARSSWIV